MAHIGFLQNGNPFRVSYDDLGLPGVSLGLAGSGKTTIIKAIAEELAIEGVPIIVLDSQGDLALMTMMGSQKEFVKRGGDLHRYSEYAEKTFTRIYTPCSTQGTPISFSPIQDIPSGLKEEERVLAIDSVVSNLLLLMDYKVRTDDFKNARQTLYDIINGIMSRGDKYPRDVNELIVLIENTYPKAKGHIPKLVRRLSDLMLGQNELLFSGSPTTLDEMMAKKDGKTPINVIFLNTLQTEQQVQFVAASVLNAIYRWMISNPEKSDKTRLMVFADEAHKFFPPFPKNPPSKEPLKRLMKEGRKYKVFTVIASQNYTDMDYKGMTQSGLYFIGRLTNRNDWEGLRPILESRGVTQEKLAEIPAGQMYVVNSSKTTPGHYIKNRWLYTEHGMPLSPNEISDMIVKAERRRKEVELRAIAGFKCPVCLTLIPESNFIEQYGQYICLGCKKWFKKEELKNVRQEER